MWILIKFFIQKGLTSRMLQTLSHTQYQYDLNLYNMMQYSPIPSKQIHYGQSWMHR